MHMLINEKIKVSEVDLTGINGENLGIISTKEALAMAHELKVDLVCLSLTSNPPPCKLVPRSEFQQEKDKEQQKNRKAVKGRKTKEIRLSAFIEEHDYDTKRRQAEKILSSGDNVQLTVRLEKKESDLAEEIVRRLLQDLTSCGKAQKGIQKSGKQVIVIVEPM